MTSDVLPVEQPSVVDYLKGYLRNSRAQVDKLFFHEITNILHSDEDYSLTEHKDSGNYLEETCAFSDYSDVYKLRKHHAQSLVQAGATSSNKYTNLESEMAVNTLARKRFNNTYSINTNISRDVTKFSSRLENFDFSKYYSSLLSINSYDHNDGKSNPYDTKEVLFPGVRYIGKNVAIFEMPPTKKLISYVEAYRESEHDDSVAREFYVSLPWQVYIATFDSRNMRVQQVQMYFSSSPILSFNHRLYLPPLLNFYSSGVLCRPMFSSMEDYEKYPANVSGVMASAYDWVWNSGSNFDITEGISEFIVSKCWKKMLEYSNLNSEIKERITISFTNFRSTQVNKISVTMVSDFYKLWQSVPIENILECDWMSFCVKESYLAAESVYYYESHRQEVYDWAKRELGLEVMEEYPDEGNEPEDFYDEDGEPRFIHYENLTAHAAYRSYVISKLFFRETTLFQALERADQFVKDNFQLSDVNYFYDFLLKTHKDITAKLL